ncbi:MAG TPA: hypothetical protein VEZ11_17085, partial [Thermoanaerobaculia bacterium]|nr:hypothetical protein [Thermoanaerobaculia bacterium]
YDIYRSSLGGALNFVSSTAGTSATDNGLFANTTYLYAVRAVAGGGVYSPFTPIDPATTIVFSDSSLTGVLIQAVHLTQLRTAVNAMRAAANLSPATFTDPTLTPGVTMIKQAHVAELRAALNEARSTIGLPAIVYTDPTITSGSTVMKAVHLTELRAGTQ